jgi:hypothetical protein
MILITEDHSAIKTSSTTRHRIEVVDRAMARVLRDKSPAEKIAIVGQAHRTAKRLLAAGIRSGHSDWSDEQIEWEVARRLLRGTT